MARKGIEEMISEIEIFIDNCKYQPLSSSKIIVPKEDLEQMVGELKLKLPNEIERCKKIMKKKNVTDARAIAMYLSRIMTDESLQRIGQEFGGRDHSTVIYSHEKISNELKTNVKLQEEIKTLKEKICE